jgi:hypothetical protein
VTHPMQPPALVNALDICDTHAVPKHLQLLLKIVVQQVHGEHGADTANALLVVTAVLRLVLDTGLVHMLTLSHRGRLSVVTNTSVTIMAHGLTGALALYHVALEQ